MKDQFQVHCKGELLVITQLEISSLAVSFTSMYFEKFLLVFEDFIPKFRATKIKRGNHQNLRLLFCATQQRQYLLLCMKGYTVIIWCPSGTVKNKLVNHTNVFSQL